MLGHHQEVGALGAGAVPGSVDPPRVAGDIRLQDVPAEPADRIVGAHAQQRGRLRVHLDHAALAVNDVDPLDDSVDHRASLGLLRPEILRQPPEAAPHLFHRRREPPDLRQTLRSQGRREISAADAIRRLGQALERRGDAPGDQHGREGRDAADDEGKRQQPPHQAEVRFPRARRRNLHFEEAGDAPVGAAQRPHRGVDAGLVEPLGLGRCVVEKARAQGQHRVAEVPDPPRPVDDPHGHPELLAQSPRES